jgi:hypothetical protein
MLVSMQALRKAGLLALLALLALHGARAFTNDYCASATGAYGGQPNRPGTYGGSYGGSYGGGCPVCRTVDNCKVRTNATTAAHQEALRPGRARPASPRHYHARLSSRQIPPRAQPQPPTTAPASS